MKRVVFLIRNIAPESFGGGERYQINLAKVLIRNGFRPIIFTASRRLIDEARNNKIEFVRAPYLRQQNWSSFRNAFLPVYWAWQLRLQKWYKRQIKKYNPVVLNIQSRDELIGASLAGIKCGRKVIWTDHADFRTWVLQNVNVRFKNQIGKWILRCAKRVNTIVLISEHEKESFEKTVYPFKMNNLVVIKNGVIDEYSNYKKENDENNSFCFVGRVVKDKGVIELIKAFKEVARKNQGVVLNIYGDGDDLMECQELAKDEERIRFYGYINDTLDAIAKNTCFVLPSYHEGLSLALLDAAMMGKTIVATDISGNREVVEEGITGLLVPVKRIGELKEAMEKVLDDKKMAEKMAKMARKKFEQEFDLEKIFKDKMAVLYEGDNNEK